MFGKLFRRSKEAPTSPPVAHWFDTSELDTTFTELQCAVQETSALANNISTQLEHKLQATELQLATLLCVITEAIIITDSHGIIQEWNTGAEILFGFSKKAAIGSPVDIIASTPANKEIIRTGFNQHEYSDKSNINKIKKVVCNHNDGHEILVEISVNVFPSSTDRSNNMIAIIRDVTAQHHEQQQREKERLLLNGVINSIMDVMMVRDQDGRWVLANKAAHQLYNFSGADDFYLKTNAEIAEEFPAFGHSLAECERTDNEAWATHKTVRSEEIVVDAHGQRQYFDVMKTPIYSDDHTKEMLIVAARNVTLLKEKREHILVTHKALNASSDIVCITDSRGCILFANKTFLVKYRYGDVRDVLGKTMSVVKSDITPRAVHKQIWDTVTSGKIWEGVLTNHDSQHRPLNVDTTIIPIVDQTLAISHYICVQRCLDC